MRDFDCDNSLNITQLKRLGSSNLIVALTFIIIIIIAVIDITKNNKWKQILSVALKKNVEYVWPYVNCHRNHGNLILSNHPLAWHMNVMALNHNAK